jgi:hypothetical protein
VRFHPADGVGRLVEDVPVRPGTRGLASNSKTTWTPATTTRKTPLAKKSAVVPPSSCDYRYVTPSTVSDSNTGEIGRAHKNADHISDLCLYERQPK